jgi:GntR family transcriptional regulator, transcriptional repressor for pyruvate dehydrogenase complex
LNHNPVIKDSRSSVSSGEGTPAFRALVLDRRKLNDKIASVIQHQILHGQLKAGDDLPPERALAALLGVNRGTVREAIPLLCERGLVEKRSGSRLRIKAMEPGNIATVLHDIVISNNCSHKELHQFRGVFEPKVAALAARNARPDDLKKLAQVLRALEAAWVRKEVQLLATMDAQFHLDLSAASHNALMQAVGIGLNVILERFMKITHALVRSEVSFWTHRLIYQAMLRRNPAEAEEAMKEQLATQPILEAEG